jgi:hypothetical protein
MKLRAGCFRPCFDFGLKMGSVQGLSPVKGKIKKTGNQIFRREIKSQTPAAGVV